MRELTMVATSPAPEVDEGPVLGVCCQGDGVLVLHALETGEACGRISVGDHPVHAIHASGTVFVATMGERAIAAIGQDGAVKRIELGVLGPSHFARACGSVFVTCTASDVIAMIDPVAATVTSRIGVGAEPHDIIAHDGLVYVGSRSDGRISVVDACRGVRLGVVDIGEGSSIEGLAISSSGEVGFATDVARSRLVAFSLGADRDVIDCVDVGRDPASVAVHDGVVYVPDETAGRVHTFSMDLEATGTYDGFERPVAVVPYKGRHWVIDRDSDTLSALEGDRIDIPAGCITANPTASGLLLSHYTDASISLVDPTNGLRWHQNTGAFPLGAIVV